MNQLPQFHLAGDIGGTKTVLALFSADQGPFLPLEKAVFPSRGFASLEEILRIYLKDKPVRIQSASFGIAGPVYKDRVKTTNLPWMVEARLLSQVIEEAPVWLLNDLQAIAYAVPHLRPEDLHTINPGSTDPHGTLGVVAPGTGLGEAFLIWEGDRYHPHPSEGGHSDFGPANLAELELLNYLMPRVGHVSYERVCSGSGMPNLYAFFKDSGRYSEPEWLKAELAQAPDPTPVIVRAAMEGRAEICEVTLDQFVAIFGSEAGNLALKVMSTGGIYLGGGIPPRIIPFLEKGVFLKAFKHKGRFSGALAKIPVHVILNPELALIGAACQGFETADTYDWARNPNL
jgi:glucokinase